MTDTVKAEFLQAVNDAILDSDSLERFINGSEDETVLTRLSAEYPTLQKALKELFSNNGIAGRFKTLADLESSSLIEGDYALVADDVGSKNGIYIKEGGDWVKSAYDPITYIDSIAHIDSNNISDIYYFRDSEGQTVYKATVEGKHYFTGLDADLKTELNSKAYIDDSKSSIFEVIGSDGKVTLRQDSNGNLHLPTIGNLTTALQGSSHGVSEYEWTTAVYKGGKFADNVLLRDTHPFKTRGEILTPEMIDPYFSYKINVLRIPSMIRIAKNEFLVLFEARADHADIGDNSSASCILTIDPDTKEAAVSDISVLHECEFLESGESMRYMNPAAVQLDDGRTILATYFGSIGKDGSTSVLYMKKSTDNGRTWGEHIDLSYLYKSLGWDCIITSSGGFVKQHEPHKGRIIMPFFNLRNNWLVKDCRVGFMYSDDNGENWVLGKTAPYESATENQVIEDYNGDLLMAIRVEQKDTPRRFARYSWELDEYIDMPVQFSIDNEPLQSGFAQGENKWDDTNGKILFSTCKWGWKHINPEIVKLRRSGLLIAVSYDGCETWEVFNYDEIDRVRVGYSNISPLDEEHVIATYESDGGRISYAVVSLKTIKEYGEVSWER